MRELPRGTVTFLFTDIEGSTRLLTEMGPAFEAALDQHDRLVREAVAGAGGTTVRNEGDSFFAVFERPVSAVIAAVDIQRGLAEAGGPIRVRIGMHTGDGVLGGSDYIGLDVHRAARIAAAGHGGQVLLSETTHALVQEALPAGVRERPLGDHRLKDLGHPEPIFDLVIPEVPSDHPPIRTLEPPATLPVYRTSFIGRERERTEIAALLEPGSILTLVGPGGTGKTRLAVEAAGDARAGFTHGVHFVDLSSVMDPALVPQAIGSALQLVQHGDRSATEILTDHLRSRGLLLVLDNVEQVIEAAPSIAAVASASPGSAFLVTSREPLGLGGERRYPVDGLDPGDEAVELFIERARRISPRFAPSAEERALVGTIVERLDGLPLAVELAAARAAGMTVSMIAEDLDQALGFLTRGPRDAPHRQRTLRDAIAWSHDLLDDAARTVFRRLAVFIGGWEPSGAAAVVGPDAMAIVEDLVDKSLVRPPDQTGRFRMLETIRGFAEERLAEDPDADAVRGRHAAFLVALGEEAELHLTGAETRAWTDRIEAEIPNMRSSMRWTLERGDPVTSMRIVAATWRVWQRRGYLGELRAWTDRVLAHPAAAGRTRERARALGTLGSLAYWQGDDGAVRPAYLESLDIYEGLGDRPGVAEATFNLSAGEAAERRFEEADRLLVMAGDLYRELGDARGYGWTLVFRAVSARRRDDGQGSRDLALRAIEQLEGTGEESMLSVAKGTLGYTMLLEGELEPAREIFLEMLRSQLGTGDLSGVAIALHYMAGVESAAGAHLRALRLAGAGERLREELGGATTLAMDVLPDPREAARGALNPAAIDAGWEEGRAMSPEQAVAYAAGTD